MIVRLPYAGNSVVADFRGFRVHPLRPEGGRGTNDPAAMVRRALAAPVAGETFARRARGARRVAVVVPDATRSAALPAILPVILRALTEAGVPPNAVTVVVACGTHPSATDDAVGELVGPLPGGVQLVQHDARNDEDLVPVGTTSTGLVVRLDQRVVEADLRVTVGAVRHHYFAGFGGGPKMVFPGVAGYREIQQNHSRVLDLSGSEPRRHPGCEPGRLHANPVAEEIAEAADLCPAQCALCLVPGVGGGFSEAFFGAPEEAFQAAVAGVRRAFEIAPAAFDLVAGSAGGRPCDSTLIQAHKGLDAVCRFLKPAGGEALFAASLDGGAGASDMERYLKDPRPESILASLRNRWVQYGHTTLRIVEKTHRHTVHLVSEVTEDVAVRLGFSPASSSEDVLKQWREDHPRASIGVMDGPAVFPRQS